MAKRSPFDQAFYDLRMEFTASTKRRFLRDIEGQIQEDEDIYEIASVWDGDGTYFAVSFDRKLNDTAFSYGYFDLVLVALDALAGGVGIFKPVSQLRVLRWNGTANDLLKVLTYLIKLNSQIKAKRLLILPYPSPPTGRRIDTDVYRK